MKSDSKIVCMIPVSSPLNRHHRRSIRLPGYDYSQPGAYFITICAHQREPLFGEIVNDRMRSNDYGNIALDCWNEIPHHFPSAELDEFVVMPNHVHGVLIISDDDSPVRARHASPLQPRRPLGTIVGSYKSAVTKRINKLRNTPGVPVWQRNYYEHVIRGERELNAIRAYIRNNPLRWALDRDNPINAPRLSISGTVDQYLRDAGL